MSEIPVKKLNASKKKFLTFQKNITKEKNKLEKRLESIIQESEREASKYPLSEHKEFVHKSFSDQKKIIEISLESCRFREVSTTKILNIIESHLQRDKPVKIEEENEGEDDSDDGDEQKNLVITSFHPSFEEIFSRAPEKLFSSSVVIQKLHKEIEEAKSKISSEKRSKKSAIHILLKQNDVKKDFFISNLATGFGEYYDSRVVLHRERLSKEYGDCENKHFVYDVFQDCKERYNEKIKVHIVHKESNISKYITKRSEVLLPELPRMDVLVEPNFFEKHYSFDTKGNIMQRRFSCLLHNSLMDHIFDHSKYRTIEQESDEKLLKICQNYDKFIGFFGITQHEDTRTVQLDPKFLVAKSVEKEVQFAKSFELAIKTLEKLRTMDSQLHDPMEIAIILLQFCMTVGFHAKRNCERNNEQWEYGADDYFPQIIYCFIRAKVPRLCTFLRYASKFMRNHHSQFRDFLNSAQSETIYHFTLLEGAMDYILGQEERQAEEMVSVEFKEWYTEKVLKKKVREEDQNERVSYLVENERCVDIILNSNGRRIKGLTFFFFNM